MVGLFLNVLFAYAGHTHTHARMHRRTYAHTLSNHSWLKLRMQRLIH